MNILCTKVIFLLTLIKTTAIENESKIYEYLVSQKMVLLCL